MQRKGELSAAEENTSEIGNCAFPSLLLHSCCAPCSSSVLERLLTSFTLTVLYYNPNIYPQIEYDLRLNEQMRYITEVYEKNKVQNGYTVTLLEAPYIPQDFYTAVSGLEHEKEGSARCFLCYELRLQETARFAKEMHFDYFTTTLSLSPHKNAAKLNEIGQKMARKYGIAYYVSDFKKKDGYKRSLELSAQYGLYRQQYCGCEFSLYERKV